MPGFHIPYDLQLTANEQDFNIPDPQSPQGILDSIRVAAQTFATTWRYDLQKGIPWLDDQALKPQNEALIRSLWYDLLSQTPGVRSVVSLTLTLDANSRKMRINFVLQGAAGVKIPGDLPLQLQ